jgi:hypothetical protein
MSSKYIVDSPNAATVDRLLSRTAQEQGEIYIRPDGKKVRRFKKTGGRPTEGKSGAGFMASLTKNSSKKPVTGGAATVSGPTQSKPLSSEAEICIRARRTNKIVPSGDIYIHKDVTTKVRRTKKTAAKSTSLDSLQIQQNPLQDATSGGSSTVYKRNSKLAESKLEADCCCNNWVLVEEQLPTQSKPEVDVYIKVRPVTKTVASPLGCRTMDNWVLVKEPKSVGLGV